jgi:hypothetical protein
MTSNSNLKWIGLGILGNVILMILVGYITKDYNASIIAFVALLPVWFVLAIKN